MMFAEKVFEPIEILSPSNDLMSDSGPASSPVRTGPAAVPKPQPESNNPRQARTAVTETDVCRRRDLTQIPFGRVTSSSTRPNHSISSASRAISNAPDRQNVVEGKRVSVRVDLGGRRIIKTKKATTLLKH